VTDSLVQTRALQDPWLRSYRVRQLARADSAVRNRSR